MEHLVYEHKHNIITELHGFIIGVNTYSWQPLGPLLKVKLLLGYMSNPTKLKGAVRE